MKFKIPSLDSMPSHPPKSTSLFDVYLDGNKVKITANEDCHCNCNGEKLDMKSGDEVDVELQRKSND